jgi:hypothetical protein
MNFTEIIDSAEGGSQSERVLQLRIADRGLRIERQRPKTAKVISKRKAVEEGFHREKGGPGREGEITRRRMEEKPR